MQNEPNGMLLVLKSQWSMSFQKTLKIPNKANLENDPMTITNVLTTDYNRKDT